MTICGSFDEKLMIASMFELWAFESLLLSTQLRQRTPDAATTINKQHQPMRHWDGEGGGALLATPLPPSPEHLLSRPHSQLRPDMDSPGDAFCG